VKQIQTMELDLNLDVDPIEDFVRIPGLLRRWEIEQVVTSAADFHIEPAGELADKTQVFAVYRRERVLTDAGIGLPVTLTLEDERTSVRARLLPISDGEPLMAVLVVGDSAEDAAALAQVREHVAKFAARSAAAPAGAAVPHQGQGSVASQGQGGATR